MTHINILLHLHCLLTYWLFGSRKVLLTIGKLISWLELMWGGAFQEAVPIDSPMVVPDWHLLKCVLQSFASQECWWKYMKAKVKHTSNPACFVNL